MEREWTRVEYEEFCDRHKDKIEDFLDVLEIILGWVDVYNSLCKEFNSNHNDGQMEEIMEILSWDQSPIIRKAFIFNMMTKEQNEIWNSLGRLKYLRFGPKQEVHVRSSNSIKERRQPKVNHIALRIGKEQKWTCIYCQRIGTEESGPDKRMWHVDHMYAQSLGGDSRPDNLVLACATCNLQKGKKRLREFLGVIR